MKRISIILAAFVLALGLTQCKKENTNTTENHEGNGVWVTLTLDNASNTKANVDPTGDNGTYNWAPVTFEAGDKIYAGYNGNYVGVLDYTSTESGYYFAGTLSSPYVEGEPLDLYFLGGLDFQPDPSGISGNTATVDISDQTSGYPVVSYAKSNCINGVHHATMTSKCSILKFNVTKPTNANDAICISGMNNVVTVDFTNPEGEDNGFAYSMEDYGRIKMRGVTSTSDNEPVAMWVIVLPQEEQTTEAKAYNEGKTCSGRRPALPQITSNKYMNGGIPMELGDFSYTVKVEGNSSTKVFLAPGNLQYQRSTQTWRFAENQWDYVGNATIGNVYEGGEKCNNAKISNGQYAGWIDLFGWGTWTTGDIITSNPDTPINPVRYEPNSSNYQWGGGDFGRALNGRSDWKTLTQSEWQHLINTRTTKTSLGDNARYAKATVNGVAGLILFPDHYVHPDGVDQPNGINTVNAVFTSNNYTAEQWAKMELFGATFLPAGGYRQGTSLNYVGQNGMYWCYTFSNEPTTNAVGFGASSVNFPGAYAKYYGCSVRLAYYLN